MAIRWHLNELMDEARLTYRELSAASGVSTEILARMIKENNSGASSRTVDRLLSALQPHIARQLTTNDLQEWIASEPPATDQSALTPPSSAPATTQKASDAAKRTQRNALTPPTGEVTLQQRQAEEYRRTTLLAQAQGVAERKEKM